MNRSFQVIKCQACGQPWNPLTAQELRVVEILVCGRSNREIAADLGVTVRCIKSYILRLFRKTGTKNRIELARAWSCELFQIGLHELGLLPTECLPLN